MDFVNELWKSVLTPGTSPALILATHLTFASLVITLSFFALYSKSIHLINLLVISILLWITLTWFINEINSLEKTDLKDNNELAESDTETKNQAVESKSSSSEPKKVIQPVQRKSKKI